MILFSLFACSGSEPVTWECQVTDPEALYAISLGCDEDFDALASAPLDASIPGARSTKTVVDNWPIQPMWFRSREPIEDDPLVRACALTFISDVGLVPTARPPGEELPGGGAASLDHALWLHRPFDPQQWHLYDAEAISHNDARGLARGSIIGEDGTLVASVVQESLWRL